MANKIVGAVVTDPVSTDMLIINRGGNLNEMLVNAVGVDHVEFTSETDGVRLYTMYRSADTTTPFGTFTVTNGVDGAGNAIPDWAIGTTFAQNSTVMFNGFLCRCTATTSVGNQPFTLAGTAPFEPNMHADWEVVPLSGTELIHDPAKSYGIGETVVINGRFYTPNLAITASSGSPVAFVIGTAADQWHNIATGLIPYHDPDETVSEDVFRRREGIYYQANSNITGATVSVPFSEGLGANQWRVAGTPNDAHVSTKDYAVNALVRVAGVLYAANSPITGSTVAVPFAIGSARNQWRLLGESNNGHDVLTAYDENDVVQVNDVLYALNNDYTGAFVAGVGANQWRVVGEPNNGHEATTNYVIDAVVRVNDVYYQNNTAGVRAFAIGPNANQWRVLGSASTGMATIYSTANVAAVEFANYHVDTAAGTVTLTVDGAFTAAFTVSDYDQSFSTTNQCIVDFGGGTTATLQTMRDSYKFYHNGTAWAFQNLKTKEGNTI